MREGYLLHHKSNGHYSPLLWNVNDESLSKYKKDLPGLKNLGGLNKRVMAFLTKWEGKPANL
jgi:hypothetical protein